VALTTHSDLT